jgi:hypothetical protein
MTWFKRIAQGFNPGLVVRARCPESGTRRWGAAGDFKNEHQEINLGRHFQGGSCATRHPGLKPWAILSDHFMVSGHNRHRGKSNPTLNPEEANLTVISAVKFVTNPFLIEKLSDF